MSHNARLHDLFAQARRDLKSLETVIEDRANRLSASVLFAQATRDLEFIQTVLEDRASQYPASALDEFEAIAEDLHSMRERFHALDIDPTDAEDTLHL